MRITVTGPRSVGKSTISRLLAKRIKIKYYSSDEIGEKAMKRYGGLDKSIKSGIIDKFIKKSAYGLIRNVYKEDNLVFDLSGGAISSKKHSEASKKVREIAKNNSIIVGLLPYKNDAKSIKFLFSREKRRNHFKEINKIELLAKTEKSFKKFPRILKRICHIIIYVEDKSPNRIVNEIVNSIRIRGII